MNSSQEQSFVFTIRDFPSGCGTHIDVSSRCNLPDDKAFKHPRTGDVPGKNLSFVAPKPGGTCPKEEPADEYHVVAGATPYRARSSSRNMNSSQELSFVFAIRDFPSGCGTHIDVSLRCNLPDEKAFKHPRAGDVPGKNLSIAAPKPGGTCLKGKPADEYHVVAAPTPYASFSHRRELETRNPDYDPTPREKVLEVLSLFKQVYKQLDRDKKARRGGDLFDATSRIDIKTLNVLENMGKQVNTEKRIGSVPGINVGDEFQYKTELRVVGLHSKTMCGIDYMNIGDVRLATSIVASEGYGYRDTFSSDGIVYTGEGGNVISKDKKTEDQKLVKGNLALANSMRQKSEVRVIRGEERWDHKGKRYVYDGLYMVEKYWVEREVRGKTVFKFKLCRIPGQAPLT